MPSNAGVPPATKSLLDHGITGTAAILAAEQRPALFAFSAILRESGRDRYRSLTGAG
jgi:hypothetical protein